MIATAATRRLTALIIATAALGAGAAVAATEASSSAPASHSIAMPKADPNGCRLVTDPLMHIESSYGEAAICP